MQTNDEILLNEIYEQKILNKPQQVSAIKIPGFPDDITLKAEDILLFTNIISSKKRGINKKLHLLYEIKPPLPIIKEYQNTFYLNVTPRIYEVISNDPDINILLKEALEFTLNRLEQNMKFSTSILIHINDFKYLNKTKEYKNIFQYTLYSVFNDSLEINSGYLKLIYDLFNKNIN